MQASKQREPIAAQLRIVGHHHHVVKETVDRLASSGQCSECAGEVAGRQSLLDDRSQRLHARTQCAFGIFGKEGRIGGTGLSDFRLAQNVADALVCGGQAGRLGQGCEGAYGLKPGRNLRQIVRALRYDALDLLRTETTLAQPPGQTLIEELGQRTTGVGDLAAEGVEGDVEQAAQR